MPKNILIAEDGKSTRQVLSFILSNRGFIITEAITGKEALVKAKAGLPDLILLDSEMPEMSGYEVYFALRQDPVCKKIPVLILVANTNTFDMPTRSVPPAEFLISKPFTAHDLLQKVGMALSLFSKE